MGSKQTECDAGTRAWMLDDLKGLRPYAEPEDPDGREETWVDFRVRLDPEGNWHLHTGDASYDTDHRGYIGCGSVAREDDEDALRASLEEAIEQALDARAEREA